MSITTQTAIDIIRREIQDTNSRFITEDDYIEEIIYQHLDANENTYTFTQRVTGSSAVWTWSLNGKRFMLWNPSFSEESGCDYRLNANGSIKLTSGTDTRTSIDVTGTRLDFNACMVDLLQRLITKVAQEAPMSVGDGSYTPPTEERLRAVLQQYRGVVNLT
jgi:hypothetical protein